MKKIAMALGFAAAAVAAAWAVTPQKWTFRTYEDFLRGKFDGISLTAEGVLSLAPRENPLQGPTEEFYLSLARTSDGVVYVGTGHGGRVFKLDREGKGELYFQASEMDVTALTVDPNGVLFAATSPQGKVYRIAEKGKGAEFFNPAEKYIWDLMFEGSGNLLAAVGENGGIYTITPTGEGRMILKSQENHILCLKRDRNGDLVAGSGGGGAVYRISQGAAARVVFETPYEEVRALAIDGQGSILASAGGAPKSRKEEVVSAPPAPGGGAEVAISVSAAQAAPAGGSTAAAAGQARITGISAAPVREPGALYKIWPDGRTKRLWSSPDELIYSLSWNETDKTVLFGTGPKGRIYALDRDEKLSLVLQKTSEQIYALEAAEAKLYIVADNPPQISTLTVEGRPSGEFLSPVLDARLPASWGRVSWEASLPQGTILQVQSRSGNTAEPNAAWSDWSPPYGKAEGEAVLSPRGRYLQLKLVLKTGTSGRATPAVSRLDAFYLPSNVAPAIARFELLPPHQVFLKPVEQEEAIWGLESRVPDPPAGRRDDLRFALAKKVERRGYQTAVWEAEDENGDALSYALWIKAAGDKDWRLLEDRWPEAPYTFATTSLPDGRYTLKVTATDAPSNSAENEKSAERTSASFLVDNAAPAVKGLVVKREGGTLAVSFQVEDQFSPVLEARLLVRPGDWRVVLPEDGICDSRAESFKLNFTLPPGADRLLSVLVKDAAGNTATIKQVF